MEGGYVNEGGQLKTKNGQKYVFNGPPAGVYVSKTCMVLSSIIVVLAIIGTALVTYYVTVKTKSNTSFSNDKSYLQLDTQTKAGMFGTSAYNNEKVIKVTSNITSDISNKNKSIEQNNLNINDRKLQFFYGWIPLHYIIEIEPNVATSSNNGSVAIEIARDYKTSFMPIVLDINNISISNVRVVRLTTLNINADELDFDSEYGEDNTTFVVSLSQTAAAKKNLHIMLTMDFVSGITDTLQGVYKTSYINSDTMRKEWMVSTQFSPIDARRAFPCFDRPDMKANFTISIVRQSITSMALSNMPLQQSSEHRPGYIKDDFMTSPKMPTYLLAFIVSNLVRGHYSDLDGNATPHVDIWTRPENTEMTHYAYSMVRKLDPWFENYFGIKNILQKIDLVSVPEFGFGAMENWGLLTFRDSGLLVPDDLEKASSSKHMEYVAQIIAHELAHQWFGNLVTPVSWNDLWLKEGFATYMSYLALNSLHKEYQILDTFTVFEFEAMQLDCDNSSHAIFFDIKSTSDIRRIFDAITYSKGSILLRMLNSIVGNDAFRGAVKELLENFAFKNADPNDLWQYMTKHAHAKGTLLDSMHIKDIMDPWITKSGYPVISVVRQETNLIITQERYILPSKNFSDDRKWVVPITFETDEMHKGDSIPTHWMTEADRQIIINDIFSSSNNSENVVYLNLNRQGYYRVNYDTDSWLALKKAFVTLPRVTRAQLLDDALHLARAEYVTYDIPLTFLMEIFTATDDELLWSAALPGLKYLTHMLQREPAYETFRAFVKFIVRPAFDRYGINEPDNESHLQLQHRSNVVSLACKFNYDRCTMGAHLIYRNWMADSKTNPIKPNMKGTIYCTALAEGSFQEWYFAYKQYKRTVIASEKNQILTSLGCTTKPWLLSKYLNLTIDPTAGILKQDGLRAFTAVAENPIGFEIAFDFLQTNIKEIMEYYGDGFSTVSQMIKSITIYMNKDYHKEQLLQFADRCRKLDLKSIETAIEQALEKVNNNIYWRKNSYYQLKGFLEAIVSEFHINIF